MTSASCIGAGTESQCGEESGCSRVIRPSHLPEPVSQARLTPSSNTHPRAEVQRCPWPTRQPSPGTASLSWSWLAPWVDRYSPEGGVAITVPGCNHNRPTGQERPTSGNCTFSCFLFELQKAPWGKEEQAQTLKTLLSPGCCSKTLQVATA